MLTWHSRLCQDPGNPKANILRNQLKPPVCLPAAVSAKGRRTRAGSWLGLPGRNLPFEEGRGLSCSQLSSEQAELTSQSRSLTVSGRGCSGSGLATDRPSDGTSLRLGFLICITGIKQTSKKLRVIATTCARCWQPVINQQIRATVLCYYCFCCLQIRNTPPRNESNSPKVNQQVSVKTLGQASFSWKPGVFAKVCLHTEEEIQR